MDHLFTIPTANGTVLPCTTNHSPFTLFEGNCIRYFPPMELSTDHLVQLNSCDLTLAFEGSVRAGCLKLSTMLIPCPMTLSVPVGQIFLFLL